MWPALFFVLSRKKCYQYATSIDTVLTEPTEQAEIDKIITHHIHRLDNPKDYTTLEAYYEMKQLAKKGIAVHHSGIIPVFKEIIEILFSKKLIKLLFATETFAVGVNMPTKTVFFCGLTKYCGQERFRQLMTHEYLQMSGRAGRRGLDKVGTVVFSNL